MGRHHNHRLRWDPHHSHIASSRPARYSYYTDSTVISLYYCHVYQVQYNIRYLVHMTYTHTILDQIEDQGHLVSNLAATQMIWTCSNTFHCRHCWDKRQLSTRTCLTMQNISLSTRDPLPPALPPNSLTIIHSVLLVRVYASMGLLQVGMEVHAHVWWPAGQALHGGSVVLSKGGIWYGV
jgi:hypothetical protein